MSGGTGFCSIGTGSRRCPTVVDGGDFGSGGANYDRIDVGFTEFGLESVDSFIDGLIDERSIFHVKRLTGLVTAECFKPFDGRLG